MASLTYLLRKRKDSIQSSSYFVPNCYVMYNMCIYIYHKCCSINNFSISIADWSMAEWTIYFFAWTFLAISKRIGVTLFYVRPYGLWYVGLSPTVWSISTKTSFCWFSTSPFCVTPNQPEYSVNIIVRMVKGNDWYRLQIHFLGSLVGFLASSYYVDYSFSCTLWEKY